MNFIHVILLAAVQGMAELLPVSSSAHVIVAEKLLGLDPTSPAMTFLLVMLHTGTMFAVLFYFWKRWKTLWLSDSAHTKKFLTAIATATVATGIVGVALKKIIEKVFLSDIPHAEIEHLFGNLTLVSASLFSVGLLIIAAGYLSREGNDSSNLSHKRSALIGAVQGLCLPFRGFSRSGATISAAMFLGIAKAYAEDFSFALAVVLTPPVILRELMRLLKAHAATGTPITGDIFLPGLVGMVFSFAAGLLALRWVSSWVEKGRWSWFGYYCLVASFVIFNLRHL
jgi:undecaprenyl-diphosphatase